MRSIVQRGQPPCRISNRMPAPRRRPTNSACAAGKSLDMALGRDRALVRGPKVAARFGRKTGASPSIAEPTRAMREASCQLTHGAGDRARQDRAPGTEATGRCQTIHQTPFEEPRVR